MENHSTKTINTQNYDILSYLNKLLNAYDDNLWIDYGKYWLYNIDQRTDGWLAVKLGRPSGSTWSYCIGHGLKFKSPEKQANILVGREKDEFSEIAIKRMNHGIIMESYVQKWYEQSRKVKIKDIGMMVPKWDLRLGVSVDGIVCDIITGQEIGKIIEIKCPANGIYWPLKKKAYLRENNCYIDPNDFSHIWKTHYDQMMIGMAVTGARECDYIVADIKFIKDEEGNDNIQGETYVETIPWNQEYWDENYDLLKEFMKNILYPILPEGFPLMPPNSSD